MNKEEFIQWCIDREACEKDASEVPTGWLEWLQKQPGTLEEIYERIFNVTFLQTLYDQNTLLEVYRQCCHPEWLTWLYNKLDIGAEFSECIGTLSNSYNANVIPILDKYNGNPKWYNKQYSVEHGLLLAAYQEEQRPFFDEYYAKVSSIKIPWPIVRDALAAIKNPEGHNE